MAVADSQKVGLLAKDAEMGSSINEKAIVRKLNKHLLVKFLLMTLLCYIGESNNSIGGDDLLQLLLLIADQHMYIEGNSQTVFDPYHLLLLKVISEDQDKHMQSPCASFIELCFGQQLTQQLLQKAA